MNWATSMLSTMQTGEFFLFTTRFFCSAPSDEMFHAEIPYTRQPFRTARSRLVSIMIADVRSAWMRDAPERFALRRSARRNVA